MREYDSIRTTARTKTRERARSREATPPRRLSSDSDMCSGSSIDTFRWFRLCEDPAVRDAPYDRRENQLGRTSPRVALFSPSSRFGPSRGLPPPALYAPSTKEIAGNTWSGGPEYSGKHDDSGTSLIISSNKSVLFRRTCMGVSLGGRTSARETAENQATTQKKSTTTKT